MSSFWDKIKETFRSDTVPKDVHMAVVDERDLYREAVKQIASSYNALLHDHEAILATVDVLEAKFRINEEKFNIIYATSTITTKDKQRIQDLEDELTRLCFAPTRRHSKHKEIDLDELLKTIRKV